MKNSAILPLTVTMTGLQLCNNQNRKTTPVDCQPNYLVYNEENKD